MIHTVNTSTAANEQILQRTVDAVARSGGGTVELPAGTYEMRDALHLRDNVRIIGEAGTILKKAPTVQSALTNVAGYGHYEFSVSEPEKFSVGMGVLISDDRAGGFYTTAATIVGQDGDTFFIDRPFAHDYGPTFSGIVTSTHSLLDGHGVQNAGASNLILDGNYPTVQHHLNGCRGGGVFLLQPHNISLEEIEVRNFHGDAVSFQQCTDVFVERCFLHHNTGGGLHPGSGSVRYFLQNNRIEDNGGCGIFYCLRTTHSLCAGNSIARNASHGISVGERDTDHILQNNVISENGGAGIFLREPVVQSGDRLWIEGNTLRANNADGEHCEFFISRGLSDVCFTGNTIETENSPAIIVGENCRRIAVAGNTINGRAQSTADIEATQENISFEKSDDFPAVGPDAATPKSVRHLGAAVSLEPNSASPTAQNF